MVLARSMRQIVPSRRSVVNRPDGLFPTTFAYLGESTLGPVDKLEQVALRTIFLYVLFLN
jgi:hypothetical protein